MIIQERKVRRLVALLTSSLLSLQAFIVPAAAMQVQEEPAPAITADQYQFEDGDFKSSPNILLPKGMTEPVFVNPETDSSETERESSAIQNNSADTSLQTMVSGQMNLDVSSVAAVFPSQNGMYLYYMITCGRGSSSSRLLMEPYAISSPILLAMSRSADQATVFSSQTIPVMETMHAWS